MANTAPESSSGRTFAHFVTASKDISLPSVGVRIKRGTKCLAAYTTVGAVVKVGSDVYEVSADDLLIVVNRSKPIESDWYAQAVAWLTTKGYKLKTMSRPARYVSGIQGRTGEVKYKTDSGIKHVDAYIVREPADDKKLNGVLHRTVLGHLYFIPNHIIH